LAIGEQQLMPSSAGGLKDSGGSTMVTSQQRQRQRQQYARLNFTDGEIVVTPKDWDVFLISAEKATDACRFVVQMDQRIKKFQSDFLIPLNEWCVTHHAKVRACYVPLPTNHLQVFVVTNSREFDLTLASEIARLELRLANGGWRVGVTQLPDAEEESLATFFSPEGALEIYAQRGPTPAEG